MFNLNNRTPLSISFLICLMLGVSRCKDVNQTEVISQGHRPCTSLIGCAKLGMVTGLRDIENSNTYPLIGKNVILEKTSDVQDQDAEKRGIIQRAYRILDNHVVRARLSKTLSLKLFKTQQGNFDIALEIGDTSTASDGRTFFKRRLQMALLPIMYKLGVMSTLMGALVVMVMKGLVIGVILLIFAVASAVKYKLMWAGPHHHEQPHYTGWSAPAYQTPSVHHTAPQDIHLHLHGIPKDAVLHRDYSSGLHRADYSVPSTAGGQTAYGTTANTAADYLSPYNRAAHNVVN